jgi:hypothetical protein
MPRDISTYQIGSVTAMMNGLLKLILSRGQNALFSSYLDHHLGSSVSFLFFEARFRNIAGAYVSPTKAIMAKEAPAAIITTQSVQRHPRY